MGSDISGDISICDAIMHEDALWLVPHWLQNLVEQWQTPKLMIRLEPGTYQRLGDPFPADFLLFQPIPTPVLKGRVQKVKGVEYTVLTLPQLSVPIPLSPPTQH